MMSVPVMSDGIRSGVNWMRLNSRPSVCAMRAHQQRLRRARQAGDQAVAADEQGDQHLFDHFVLADDHAADLRDDVVRALSGSARSGPCRSAESSVTLGWLVDISDIVSYSFRSLSSSNKFLGRLEAGAASSARYTSSRASSCRLAA